MIDPIYILVIGMVIVVGGIIVFKLHPFIALIAAAIVVAILTPANELQAYYIAKGLSASEALKQVNKSIGERIATEFGNTCMRIGLLIASASIIGKAMFESGAAEKVVRSMIKVTGIRNAPVGFILSGFFMTIPVFIDTVLFLMMPLAKAMSLRSSKNYLLLVLTVIAGATMANSYVPPSPGPLYLVSALNVPIGLAILCGILLGLCTISVGYLIANYLNKKYHIPLRDSPDIRLDEIKAIAGKADTDLPALGWAVLPALFPMIMICIRSFTEAFYKTNSYSPLPWIHKTIEGILFFGDKNIAILTGAAFALMVLVKEKNTDQDKLKAFLQSALMNGGAIILITAAGGAFGGMLQQSGISTRIADMTKGYQIALIPLAFLITMVVRTAQGSATVALITASGILAGMAQNADLGFNTVYLYLAIGSGAKLIPWMNDAGFWIMCKTSNLTEKEALKTIAPMQSLMGITGLILTMIAAKIFPMV